MKVQDVLTCSFASWYPFFQKITIKSKILALPQEFIDYLLADNLVLGDTCQPPGRSNYTLKLKHILKFAME